MSKGKYAWSKDQYDEIWRGGPCDTIAECVKEAIDEGYTNGDTIAIGEIERYNAMFQSFGETIIDRLCQDAYDEVGEVSEDWLTDVSKEQLIDLDNKVFDVVTKWIKDCGLEPTFYKINPTKIVTIGEKQGSDDAAVSGGKL